jgi:hypothetical protein
MPTRRYDNLTGPARLGRFAAVALCAAVLAATQQVPVACDGCVAFASPVSYFTGTHPTSVAVADFNGDGKRDLATADQIADTVSILLGNGDGTFAVAVPYAAGSQPVFVAADDVNGDGYPDLAVANIAGSNVSILLNNGDGTFAAAVNYAVGEQPLSVAIGDLNADGKPDLAVGSLSQSASNFPNNVWILLGTGTGTFGTPTRFAGGSGPASVAEADLNDDGKIDLAVANSGDIRSASVLVGHGDGSFDAPNGYNPGGGLVGFVSLAIGDLNGDAIADLAVADASNGGVWVLLGNGDATFGSAVEYLTGGGTAGVAIKDVNGDGRLDVAVANPGSSNISILLGNANGSLAAPVNFAIGIPPVALALADFNGDGKPDVVVANRDANKVAILLSLACTPPPVAPTITTQPASQIVHAGDTVTWSASASGTPAPGIQWQYSTNSGAAWNDIAGANATSYSFVAAVGDSARQFRAVFANASGSTATMTAGLTVTSDRPFLARLDGDGLADLSVWRPNDGTWYWLNSSNGYNTAGASALQWGSQAQGDVPLQGDIDGDGKTDLIAWRAGTGTWYWLTSSSGYSYAAQGSRQWGNASLGDVPLVADLDGDGKAELIVWRASTGTWYWLSSLDGYNYAGQRGKQWGNLSFGDVPLLGDLDGDGRADLTVWRASTGTWLWLTSSSGYAAQGQQQWGSSSQLDSPFLRDVDGDGKADLVVWRPATGMWFWLTSSSGYNYAAQQQLQWGRQGDTALAADLDGDGKSDFVVWRPSTGTWFWLTSSTGYNYSGQQQRQWGSAAQ